MVVNYKSLFRVMKKNLKKEEEKNSYRPSKCEWHSECSKILSM